MAAAPPQSEPPGITDTAVRVIEVGQRVLLDRTGVARGLGRPLRVLLDGVVEFVGHRSATPIRRIVPIEDPCRNGSKSQKMPASNPRNVENVLQLKAENCT